MDIQDYMDDEEVVVGECSECGEEKDVHEGMCEACYWEVESHKLAHRYQVALENEKEWKAQSDNLRQELKEMVKAHGSFDFYGFRYSHRKPSTKEVWDKTALDGFAEADDKLASLRETVVTHKWSANAIKKVKGYALARPEIMEMREIVDVAGSLVIKAVKS